MAEDPTPETETQQVFSLNDPFVETIYANTTHAIVGQGDITLYFGFQPIEGNNIPASNVKRIALTHDSFMRMMEYWAARYRLLETLYNGKPQTLRDLDQDIVGSAFDTMLGRSGEEADKNGTSNVSTDNIHSFSSPDED